MSIPSLRGVAAPSSVSAASASGLPQALVDAQASQRKEHLNADGTPRLTQIGDRMIDLGKTTVGQLPAGAFSALLNQLKDRPDAGRALVVAENADLHTLRYSFGSREGMQAWLASPPKGDTLVLNVAIAPSCHAGNTPGEKAKNYELFGKTNVYNIEVRTKQGDLLQSLRFDVRANDVAAGERPSYEHPVYATLSPDITIDTKKLKGQDVVITGWADGSAGVAGYVERRKTTLHL